MPLSPARQFPLPWVRQTDISEPSWKMRAMNQLSTCCKSGLHASALRRSYIPMNGALPGIVPAARSRLMAAFLHSHPCGGCMVHLMERECRIHKDKEPQGSSPYAAVAGATIPVALGKANVCF